MSRPAAYRRLWSHELKEIVIRIAVFNRSADYNPKSDPVVRVEAHPSSKARTVLRRGNPAGCKRKLQKILLMRLDRHQKHLLMDLLPPVPTGVPSTA
jgi:hypothetical protein